MNQNEDLKALQDALPEYEITPHNWKRGDPVRNNADLMAKNADDQEQDLPFGKDTIMTYEGLKIDGSFCAPELIDWDTTTKLHQNCPATE